MALLPRTTFLVLTCMIMTLACNWHLCSGVMKVRYSAILSMFALLGQSIFKPLVPAMYLGMESPRRNTESWSLSGSDSSDGTSISPQMANSESVTLDSLLRALKSFRVHLSFILCGGGLHCGDFLLLPRPRTSVASPNVLDLVIDAQTSMWGTSLDHRWSLFRCIPWCWGRHLHQLMCQVFLFRNPCRLMLLTYLFPELFHSPKYYALDFNPEWGLSL